MKTESDNKEPAAPRRRCRPRGSQQLEQVDIPAPLATLFLLHPEIRAHLESGDWVWIADNGPAVDVAQAAADVGALSWSTSVGGDGQCA